MSDTSYAFIDQLEQPVAFWKNALLKGNKRNYLRSQKNPLKESLIDFPDKNKKGEWSRQYAKRVEKAKKVVENSNSIANKIEAAKSTAIRNGYTLEVYEQVNKLVAFSSNSILLLDAYDLAQNEEDEQAAMAKLRKLDGEFSALRKDFEEVFSKTRILTKPEGYILDQDHHVHLANQSISFDWQFYAEILFLEKLASEDFGGKLKQQLD